MEQQVKENRVVSNEDGTVRRRELTLAKEEQVGDIAIYKIYIYRYI